MKQKKSVKSSTSKAISKNIRRAKVLTSSVAKRGMKLVRSGAKKPVVKNVMKAMNSSTAALTGAVTGLTEGAIRRMPDSAYMNPIQINFFKMRLIQQRNEVLARQAEVKDRLNQQENFADPADRATAEEEHWLDLRLREREAFLLRKIDESMRRIKDGEYGYCKVTGERIGIPRLLARPTAEVCVDVKGQNEHIEAQFRDR